MVNSRPSLEMTAVGKSFFVGLTCESERLSDLKWRSRLKHLPARVSAQSRTYIPTANRKLGGKLYRNLHN